MQEINLYIRDDFLLTLQDSIYSLLSSSLLRLIVSHILS